MASEQPLKIDRRVALFAVLTALSGALLILCNLVGGKLLDVQAGNVHVLLSAGLLPMPLGFVLSSLIQEFYGTRASKLITGIAVGLSITAVLFIGAVSSLPFASVTELTTWQGVEAESFRRVFMSSQRIFLASLTAFAVSQFCQIALLTGLQRILGTSAFGLRAMLATIGSQVVDTLIVELLAWYGILSLGQMVSMAATSFALKFVLSLVVGPVASLSRAALETWLRNEARPTLNAPWTEQLQPLR